MRVRFPLFVLGWLLLGPSLCARARDVNVKVDVKVEVKVDSKGKPSIKQPSTVSPTFQSDFSLRTGDSKILVSPLFREPRTPDNQRMELLYSGCFPVKRSQVGPPVAREDFIIYARLANDASGTGWGANARRPAKMLGLFPVVRIPHSALFNYVVHRKGFPRAYRTQVGDVQVLGVVKNVQAVQLNRRLPPTMAEFMVLVEIRIYPAGVKIVLP